MLLVAMLTPEHIDVLIVKSNAAFIALAKLRLFVPASLHQLKREKRC